ncbi:HNH endonuclease signature motif containing protein [Sphingomonas endophytica]|uniref:HNH endonuclease n=1 Tax=Sphingomonas endophytica TaxID=869719 RepID=A0A147I990_9SPHN|nr:HNH endonuclease signature motif containing protein [Sphingomonas endophytica]KTT76117.1 HNH endonuclease [Sphingomonas endophytica]
MAGRIKRKAGLAAAAARTERESAAPDVCALCGRPLGRRVEWHHVVPRSEGGTHTVPLHPICHRAIHASADNVTLARAGTLEAIRERPPLARFLRWIADKPADFHAPTRRARESSQ